MRLLMVILVFFVACATHSQVMVNPAGQTMVCQSHGSGIIGAISANQIQGRCEASLRAAGFIEIERAGAVGLQVSDSLVILRVIPHSPADSVGLQAGDRVLSVDGQTIQNREALQTLLFGDPGLPVRIRLERQGQTVELVPVRRPYHMVYGTPRPRGKK